MLKNLLTLLCAYILLQSVKGMKPINMKNIESKAAHKFIGKLKNIYHVLNKKKMTFK